MQSSAILSDNATFSGYKVQPRLPVATCAQAEEVVRTPPAGDDPTREDLLDTSKRVVNAYAQWFSGYTQDPADVLRRTFEEVTGYDEMIILRAIEFSPHCEHHIASITGRAHVGYLPANRVVGISNACTCS